MTCYKYALLTSDEPVTSLKYATLWSRTRVAIMSYVNSHPGTSHSACARALGLHPSTVIRDVILLRQAGAVLVIKPRGKRDAQLHVVGRRRWS